MLEVDIKTGGQVGGVFLTLSPHAIFWYINLPPLVFFYLMGNTHKYRTIWILVFFLGGGSWEEFWLEGKEINSLFSSLLLDQILSYLGLLSCKKWQEEVINI